MADDERHLTSVPDAPEGTVYASDLECCVTCGMPEFDHGDGSPTDHPYVKPLDPRPCEVCGEPEGDPEHLEGCTAPQEHNERPDEHRRDTLANRRSPHAYVAPPDDVMVVPTPVRYTVVGNDVMLDGEKHIECAEPGAAAGLVEILNYAVEYDRQSRARVGATVRKDRIELLRLILENPSKVVGPRTKVETAAHWAARAVMKTVEPWL